MEQNGEAGVVFRFVTHRRAGKKHFKYMRIIPVIILLFKLSSLSAQKGKELFKFYSKDFGKNDTTYCFSIYKNSGAYKFIFPETVSSYFILKDSVSMIYDTVSERRRSVFGPYIFFRKRNRIQFKDLSRSRKPADLYLIAYNEEFLAPDLFSSSTDSYNIMTQLIDSNIVLKIGNNKFNCFKFLQIEKYDNIRQYSVVLIDKGSLLPLKFEYYKDKELKQVSKEIFSVIPRW